MEDPRAGAVGEQREHARQVIGLGRPDHLAEQRADDLGVQAAGLALVDPTLIACMIAHAFEYAIMSLGRPARSSAKVERIEMAGA